MALKLRGSLLRVSRVATCLTLMIPIRTKLTEGLSRQGSRTSTLPLIDRRVGEVIGIPHGERIDGSSDGMWELDRTRLMNREMDGGEVICASVNFQETRVVPNTMGSVSWLNVQGIISTSIYIDLMDHSRCAGSSQEKSRCQISGWTIRRGVICDGSPRGNAFQDPNFSGFHRRSRRCGTSPKPSAGGSTGV
ncbi:hypothetical protein BDM02DRAFT_1918326 [Thelephora ganbajun]|uniref:Uncharacterized protein n=1 Tax=Thelephora ganbajun TaxID=370292 RepID=A0ACB6ZVK4_THEGA|nr:hypothetical protein BDM02DRAFT_1918326 [Thelephora ganbajun]